MQSLAAPDLETDSQRFSLLTGFLLFIFFASLYIFLSPGLASQPWDSLSYAYATEEKGIQAIWGNHPLGHFIFFLIYNFANQVGYQGRALPLFKTVNGILGGIIVAVFFFVSTNLMGIKKKAVIGFSLLLGTSYGFWYFAGTSEIYHFSILSSLLAWAAMFNQIIIKKRTRPVLSGMLTGLAITFHQLNVVLLPVGLAFILLTSRAEPQASDKKMAQLAFFLGSSTSVAILGTLLLGCVATSSFSLPAIFEWMRGYFGDPTYGRSLNLSVLNNAWLTMAQAVLFSTQNQTWTISSAVLALLVMISIIGIRLHESLDVRKRTILAASALYCLITWPLILWWEPHNPKFWLLTLLPWMTWLALSFEASETTLRDRPPAFGTRLLHVMKAAPFVLSILLLSINLPSITNGMDDAKFDEAMNLWLDHSSPEDVLITAGDLIPQLRYWRQRPNTVFLYRSLQASQDSSDHFDALREQIEQALCGNHQVLIAPAASDYMAESELSLMGVSRDELRSFLYETARRGEIGFSYRNVWDRKLLPVYVLKKNLPCSH